MPDLFSSTSFGGLALGNRVVMAPMTRSRAGEGNVPHDLNAEYYRQRAGAGLIITEASQVTPQGVGYIDTPGIHTDAQVEGWKLVTDAVHQAGGQIVLQLWHVGRVSHPYFHGGALPVAPSAIAPEDTQVFTPDGMQPAPTPRALKTEEIAGVVDAFVMGTRMARQAGFDGVEVHGANGYLLEQFLFSGSNTRDDAYGGSLENRARLLLEVVDAVSSAWSPDRVGVRLSPRAVFNGARDDNREETATYVAQHLSPRGLAYLHVIDPIGGGMADASVGERIAPLVREHYTGNLILNGGYDKASAQQALDEGLADAVAFGVPYIANPDLVERMKRDAPLAQPNPETFYGGGAEGYTDYPTLEQAEASA
jgi:N-ethylmaleimide reductase